MTGGTPFCWPSGDIWGAMPGFDSELPMVVVFVVSVLVVMLVVMVLMLVLMVIQVKNKILQ